MAAILSSPQRVNHLVNSSSGDKVVSRGKGELARHPKVYYTRVIRLRSTERCRDQYSVDFMPLMSGQDSKTSD